MPISNLHKILFIDVETVPQCELYENLDERGKTLWDRKAKYIAKEEQTPAEVYERAGIYAEFGKIVCISAGFIDTRKKLHITSFYGDDEVKILQDFAQLLNQHYNHSEYLLAAHNGKEFDFPYIARRMLINRIALPLVLDISGKKPWQIPHIDTLEMWKFGDYKHYTSLDLMAHIFGIPTPKDDITGADVYRVYYEEKNLERIVKYCEKDVVTLIKLYLCLKRQTLEDYDWD